MQKWEYIYVDVGSSGDTLGGVWVNGNKEIGNGIFSKSASISELWNYLNKLGDDGWEMVTTEAYDRTHRSYWFKRQKE